MNIEEERKAFEQKFKPDPGVKWSTENQWWYAIDNSWLEGLHETVSYFKGWLAAKEHAAEMAKPTVKIKVKPVCFSESTYPFVVSLFEGEVFNGVLEDFKTETDAKEWAKRNGYRVIE